MMRDVSAHLRELDDRGFTTFENLLSRSDIEEARYAVLGAHSAAGSVPFFAARTCLRRGVAVGVAPYEVGCWLTGFCCAGRCCNRATMNKEFPALLDPIHRTTSRAPYVPTISLHVAPSSDA